MAKQGTLKKGDFVKFVKYDKTKGYETSTMTSCNFRYDTTYEVVAIEAGYPKIKSTDPKQPIKGDRGENREFRLCDWHAIDMDEEYLNKKFEELFG